MRVHELHAPVKVVQRSKGRSATAAAAYRAGERIEDERTGQVHDYTRKQGIEADALLLPDNAPEWAHDRAKLWNSAELHEKHPRAQTAREVTVSFPSEFSAEQRREAGMKIGQWIVFRYGVAVDVAWHEPSRNGDERNHHMHALFTTRRFDENGEWAKTKDRTLDDLKKGPEEIKALRLGVADALNNIAARDKLDVYAEHLSYEQRGLDKEPTQHMGPIATGMERDGIETDIGNKNREITARNEERRKLQAEHKVIDIEIARQQLQARRQEEQGKAAAPSPAPAEGARQQPEDDPYAAFYSEAQARRSAMLADLDSRHGEQEKQLRQEIAGLASAQDNAGFFAKVWRNVTGRARQDKEQMATAASALDQIQRQRQAAHENFERDRQVRLEALKTAQQQMEAQRELDAQPLARAVGDVPAAQARSQPAQTRPVAEQAPSSTGGDYEARRRAYFQRLGMQRKAEREGEQLRSQAEQPKAPTLAHEARKPQAPEPAREFDQAASGAPEPASPSPAPSQDAPKTPATYEDRRAAYMRRIKQQREQSRERDNGPTLDRG